MTLRSQRLAPEQAETVFDQEKKIEAIRSIDSRNHDRRNYWGELAIWSNRRLGEILVMAQENGTLARRGKPKKENSQRASLISLDDIGIKYDQSARAQKLAAIPEETIEEYMVRVADQHDKNAEVSRAGLMRHAREEPARNGP